MKGYQDAAHWLRIWQQYPEQAPPPVTMRQFQLEFERMVVLDYIIRNTGRCGLIAKNHTRTNNTTQYDREKRFQSIVLQIAEMITG